MDTSERGGRGRDKRRWRLGEERRGLAWQRKKKHLSGRKMIQGCGAFQSEPTGFTSIFADNVATSALWQGSKPRTLRLLKQKLEDVKALGQYAAKNSLLCLILNL